MCESAAPRLGLNCRLLPVGGCVHSRRRAEGTRGKNHDGGAAVAISKPNLRTLLRAMGRSDPVAFRPKILLTGPPHKLGQILTISKRKLGQILITKHDVRIQNWSYQEVAVAIQRTRVCFNSVQMSC